MKTVTPALAALINSGNFQFAHNYTITLFGTLGNQSVIRLTDADIDVVTGGGQSVSLPGLLAHYTFDSTTWLDSSTNANNLTPTGDPAVGAGQINGAVALDGLPSYFTFANASAFSLSTATSPFSITAWVKSTQLNGCILSLRNSTTSDPTNNEVFDLVIGYEGLSTAHAGQVATVLRGNDGLGLSNIVSTGTINDGNFHFVCWTRSTAKVQSLYIDGGAAVSTTDTMSTGATVNSTTAAVGVELIWLSGGIPSSAAIAPFGAPLIGRVDDLQFYNRALTSTEVAEIYAAGAQAKTTYSSKTVQVDQRANQRLAHWKRGLDVDTAVVVLAPRTTDPANGTAFPDVIGSVPFLEAARGGALDGADVQIDRVFFNTWPNPYASPLTPVGAITIFAGTPAEIDVNDTLVVMTLNDYRQLLQNKYPRVVYQLACTNTLFDAGCTLLPASFAVTGIVVAGGSTRQQITATASVTAPTSPGSGTFTLGKITFTSGKNAGFSRTVRLWDGHTVFQLLTPFPFTVSAGDVFTAYAGCDKQQTTCTAFANLVNFGGEPFIPDATNAA